MSSTASKIGFVSRRCGVDEELPAEESEALAPSYQSDCLPDHEGWVYNTAESGNGNQGHLYGIDLSPELKTALVEYLETF